MSLLAGHNEGHGLDGVQLLFGQCPNREVNIFIGAFLLLKFDKPFGRRVPKLVSGFQ